MLSGRPASLKSGWNLISISSSEGSEEDVVISLTPGWNLIGYSSDYEDDLLP